jgi:hypothetical protein
MHPMRFLGLILTLILGFSLLFMTTSLLDGFVVLPQQLETISTPAFYNTNLPQGSSGVLSTSSGHETELFWPSNAQSKQGKLLSDKAFSTPEQCGSCHGDIYKHWKQSRHADSGQNPAYLAVKEQLSFERGQVETRLCVGCHAPVALLTGQSDGYSDNRPSSRQGVSCGFCHSIETIHSGNAGYLANPGRVRQYIGAPELARWLLWRKPAAHRADWQSPVLTSGEVCQACHDFRLQPQNGGAKPVVLQDTWQEWEQSKAARRGLTCQSCHFRPANNPDGVHPGEVTTGIHRNNVLFHTLAGEDEGLSSLKRNLSLAVREYPETSGTLQQRVVQITVTNHNDAHSIPTGVGDLRQLWLEVTLIDKNNQAQWQSGGLNRAGDIQAGAVLFQQRLTDAKGREITGHQVWRTATIASDTRLRPEERRTVMMKLPQYSQTRLQVRLLWRVLPAHFSREVLQHPPQPIHELARWPR